MPTWESVDTYTPGERLQEISREKVTAGILVPKIVLMASDDENRWPIGAKGNQKRRFLGNALKALVVAGALGFGVGGLMFLAFGLTAGIVVGSIVGLAKFFWFLRSY